MNNYVDNTIGTQNIISICTGIRGLERGLERTGMPMRTLVFMEIEAFIIANMVAQMEVGLLAEAPVWTNLKTFDGRPFRGLVHGITAGYPCQPFSNAGKRGGVDDERHLWPYILEQIKIIGPEWVYFENVAGHLSMGYAEVRRSLSDIGYRVEEGIFTAEEVGAPHRRERLFILGVMENAGIIRWRRGRTSSTPGCEREVQTTGSSATLEQSRVGLANPASPGQQITGSTASSELSTEGGAGLDNRSEQYSPELGHTQNIEQWDDGTVESSQYSQSRGSGTDVDNTGSDRLQPEHKVQAGRSRPELTGKGVTLGNSFNEGLQGYTGDDSGTDGWPQQERSVATPSLFPAGQGNYQHEWEEPRTVKSKLEHSVDGYDFTEDLHRAIGNSVVEQVAELAFLTLLDKHIKNSSHGSKH